MTIHRTVLTFCAWMLVARSEARNPLTLEEVLDLLRNNTALQPVVLKTIQERGTAFDPSASVVKTLRLAGAGAALVAAIENQPFKRMTSVRKTESSPASRYELATSLSRFEVDVSPRGEITLANRGGSGGTSTSRRRILAAMGRTIEIKNLWYRDLGNDLLLLYEVEDLSDCKLCTTFIRRISQGDLTDVWRYPSLGPERVLDLGSYNAGRGLIEGNALYVSAKNVAAKVDLNTGKVFWVLRLQGVGNQFMAFGEPFVWPETVRFRPEVRGTVDIEYSLDPLGGDVWVHKETGKLVK